MNGGDLMQFDGVSRSHIFAFVNQNSCWLIFILYVKKQKKNSTHFMFVFPPFDLKKIQFFFKELLCIIMRYICNPDLISCNVDLTESRIMNKILSKTEGICLV